MEMLQPLTVSLIAGEDQQVFQLTQELIRQKVAAQTILNEGLLKGMNEVGEKFKNHEIFLPEVLLAAKAMYAGMNLLKPLLIHQGSIHSKGKIVLGTIRGDLHDIGKNLVGIMLRGAGFEVIDLGNDVAPENFVATAQNQQATVIGMSALLTTTMWGMKEVIDLLKKQQLHPQIKTIIGGAPVSEDFAREIGADAYGFDASHSIERLKELIKVN